MGSGAGIVILEPFLRFVSILWQESCPLFHFSPFFRWAGSGDDVGYSPAHNTVVLTAMLAANNMALWNLFWEECVSEAT
jgi:hypothetical protein